MRGRPAAAPGGSAGAGGEAGLEDLLERPGRDARPVVLHRERQSPGSAVLRGTFVQPQLNASSLRHGLGRVLDQVYQNAGQVLAGEPHRQSAALDIHGDGDHRPGQGREEIAIGQQLRGQIGDRLRGHPVPVPAVLRPFAAGRFGCSRMGESTQPRGAFQRRQTEIEEQQLLDQPAAGRSHQPEFAGIVDEGSCQHPRLLQQIAIEPQRRDHVAGVMRHLGQAFAPAAQVGQCLHHRLDPPARARGLASGLARSRQARLGLPCSGKNCCRQPDLREINHLCCLLLHGSLPFSSGVRVRGQRSEIRGQDRIHSTPACSLFPSPYSLVPSP